MKYGTNTVPAVFTNDRKTIFFSIGLDGGADITEVCTRFDCLNAQIQAFLTYLRQSLCKNTACSHDKGFTGIAVVPVLDQGDVNIHDVAIF